MARCSIFLLPCICISLAIKCHQLEQNTMKIESKFEERRKMLTNYKYLDEGILIAVLRMVGDHPKAVRNREGEYSSATIS